MTSLTPRRVHSVDPLLNQEKSAIKQPVPVELGSMEGEELEGKLEDCIRINRAGGKTLFRFKVNQEELFSLRKDSISFSDVASPKWKELKSALGSKFGEWYRDMMTDTFGSLEISEKERQKLRAFVMLQYEIAKRKDRLKEGKYPTKLTKEELRIAIEIALTSGSKNDIEELVKILSHVDPVGSYVRLRSTGVDQTIQSSSKMKPTSIFVMATVLCVAVVLCAVLYSRGANIDEFLDIFKVILLKYLKEIVAAIMVQM